MQIADKHKFIATICKAVVFCLIFGMVMRATSKVLWLQDDTYTPYGFQQFYDLPEDSVDVVTFGSSGMREYYNVNEAFHYTGISSVSMATSRQPFIAVKYLIEEVEKTQHPQVYVIDIRQLEDEAYPYYLEDLRKVTDSMHFNKTRLDLINRAFELDAYAQSDPDANKIDYIFSYFLYHNRWDELSALDFGNYKHVSWMGYSLVMSEEAQEGTPAVIAGHEPAELVELAQIELAEVLDYCKALHESQGTEFLFLDSLAWSDEIALERGVTVQQAVVAAGFLFIDTRELYDAMGLDASTDFRNYEHVNTKGSTKYTDYLAVFLQQTYGLADHRGDSTYDVWQENYDGFQTALQIAESQ